MLFRRKQKQKSPRAEAAADRRALLARAAGKAGWTKRRLLREAALAAGFICALAVMIYLVSEWSATRDETRNRLKTLVSQSTEQIATVQKRMTRMDQSRALYDKIIHDNKKGEIPLDREQAKERIQGLADKYMLSSLRITMSPVRDMEGTKFRNDFFTVQACEIVLALEAVSDEHVMAFLRAVKQVLPGRIRVGDFSMVRASPLTPQTMVAITQSGKVPMVKADLRLVWMGMRANPPKTEAAASAAVPPAEAP